MTATAELTSSVARVFDRVAALYDTPLLQQVVYRPIQDLVLEAIAAHRPAHVLDVGCGTGILAERIRRELRPTRIVGCDPSAGMLEMAARREPEIEWLLGTAETIPLPDGNVDAVVSSTAFHFFDQRAAISEFARVLAPAGVVAIGAATAHTETTARAFDAAARLVGTGFVPSAGALRRMFDAAGLTVVEQRRPRRGLSDQIDPMMLTVAVKPHHDTE